jgi:aspartyl/glutamyl-tRNA(Asn/Gln) amidotransferase C subunit
MEEIVAWVDKLSELELGEGEDEISSPVFFSLPFRSDDIKDSFSVDLALANSPEKSRDFIKVPKVIEDK